MDEADILGFSAFGRSPVKFVIFDELELLTRESLAAFRKPLFDSWYAILKLLGWSDRGSDYDALEHALGKWMDIEVKIDRFYVPDHAVTSEIEQESTDFGLDKRGRPRT